ncbi:MAG: phage holin family protein [Paracoccus sp. (in: a-proteobacteria)]
MYDYVNQMQLALGDKARRAALKAGGAITMMIGTGFLIAAIWNWIAWYLELGPIFASLIIGGIFTLAGLIVWLMGTSPRHPVPTTDDLRREVGTRLNLAADAAMDKVKNRAESAMGNAQDRVSSLFGSANDRVRNLADDAAEMTSSTAETAARAMEQASDAVREAHETLNRTIQSPAGPAIGLAGAFALGMILAGAMRRPHGK